MPKANAFYAQSGGPTSVINASACGVIETARQHDIRVLAGRNGIIGALQEELIDTSLESAEAIAALKYTPAAAFGSCRYKLKSIEENRAEYERLINVFKAHDIKYFFYNGGGDSQDTSHKVSQLSQTMGYPITCIGIPKTVDNDLPITDNCPGFGSVAKYIATATLETALDVQSMCTSSTKVFVLEVMGRHAGWIAAAGGLAKQNEGDAPHIILFPEIPFQQQAFLDKVKACVEKHGYCSIVASEGTRTPEGKFLAEQGTVDKFGHAQLGGIGAIVSNMIKDALGYKYHYALVDYLQRCAGHLASKTDRDQAYAVGKAAVEYALAGKNAIMPAIVRTSNAPYKWTIGEAPLADVANVEKEMPRDFISEDGFGITDKAKEYLQPLIEGEEFPPFKNGLPVYANLKNKTVAKKLEEAFAV